MKSPGTVAAPSRSHPATAVVLPVGAVAILLFFLISVSFAATSPQLLLAVASHTDVPTHLQPNDCPLQVKIPSSVCCWGTIRFEELTAIATCSPKSVAKVANNLFYNSNSTPRSKGNSKDWAFTWLFCNAFFFIENPEMAGL